MLHSICLIKSFLIAFQSPQSLLKYFSPIHTHIRSYIILIMKTTFAVVAGLASVASAQVTALITPTASAPSGCATSFSGAFEISAVDISSVAKRQLKVRHIHISISL